MEKTKPMHELTKNMNGTYTITAYTTYLLNRKIERDIIKIMTVEPEEVGQELMYAGIDIEDIKFAVQEMEDNHHDSASFGVNGGFVCTFNSEPTVH